MVFRYRATGSGEVIETMNPIYDYSTGNGGGKPPTTDKYPADKWTGVLPKPKGERAPFASDKLEPRDAPSGAHFIGKSGPSASPGVKVDKSPYSPLNRGVPRGIANKNDFERGFDRVGTGEMTAKGSGGDAGKDRGVPYINSRGKRDYMGRSG